MGGSKKMKNRIYICLKQLILLLQKNLLASRRSKGWILVEICLPLVILLPISYFITSYSSTDHVKAASFPSFEIKGTTDDLFLSIGNMEPVIRSLCYSSVSLGLVFSDTSHGGREIIVQELANRYSEWIYPKIFESKDLLEEALENKSHCSYIGGVVFNEFNLRESRLSYLMRVGNGYTGSDVWLPGGPYSITNDTNPVPHFPNYWSSGLLSLQFAINSIFFKHLNAKSLDYVVTLTRMPEPAYYDKKVVIFFEALVTLFSLLLVPFISHSAGMISSEKESGMMSYLMVMGLKPLVYYVANFIFASAKIFMILLPPSIMILPALPLISPSIFLTTMIIFGLGVTSFTMLATSVFHRAGLASKMSIIVWFFSIFLPHYFDSKEQFFMWILDALNINVALARCFAVMRDYMLRDTYLGWSNVFDESSDSHSFISKLLVLGAQVVWINLLALYLTHVHSLGEVPAKKPWFLLPAEKRKNSMFEAVDDAEDGVRCEYMQPDGQGIDMADVDIRRLSKVYSNKRVVDSLTFRAYRGNVTVLLGENGAGKSTTFAMIAGVKKPTSGHILIQGDILDSSSLESCQMQISLCPQYNPIFDMLTVREHLNFFCQLKNNQKNNITTLIEEVGLTEKSNELAKNLSGGMKRKLCVAMSLVGDTRIVLMDEPTAGMDTYSRYMIRDVLEKYKHDRTIILTTHYMDEADSLADRIAIMARGRLVCCGTSQFLKTRFGTGYLMSIVLKDQSDPQRQANFILDIIRSHVEGAVIHSLTSHQLTILLPTEHKENFSDMFAKIEAKSDRLGIVSFGVSLNTLEQVFLKVGDIADMRSGGHEDADLVNHRAMKISAQSERYENFLTLVASQMLALIVKRYLSYKRKFTRLIFQLLLPLLLFSVSLYFITYSSPNKFNTEEVLLNADELVPSKMLLEFDDNASDIEKSFTNLAEKIPRYVTETVDARVNLSDVILGMPKVLPAMGLAFSISKLQNGTVHFNAMFNGNSRHGPVIALSFLYNALIGNKPDSISLTFSPLNEINILVKSNGQISSQLIALTPVLSVIFSLLSCACVYFIVEERANKFHHQQFLTGLHPFTYWLSIVVCDLFIYSLACLLFISIIIFLELLVESRVWLILLWLLYFWSVYPINYCISLLFTNGTRAYSTAMAVNLITAVAALMIIQILTVFLESAKTYVNTTLMILLPSYAYLRGYFTLVLFEAGLVGTENIYDWKALGQVIIYSTFSGLFYWVLLILAQSRRLHVYLFSLYHSRSCANYEVQSLLEDDVDVAAERERIEQTPNSAFVLAVRNVNKYYGSHHAVNNLSFGIQPKECFGLLGVNGAGKTSTFDILTGTSFCTYGDAFINGRSINMQQVLGFCPQFDALLEHLTVNETLRLMASLRGFKRKCINLRVYDIIEGLALTNEADKLVKNLSGGQKRRLSLGVALISNSQFIMLDEPTAGIDPHARRNIWDVLTAVRDQDHSILLTSHSMDECEALCTRVGIMHNGSLIAIGGPQHIKSRFGEGYTLTVTLDYANDKEDIIRLVAKLFPNSSIKSLLHPLHLVWHIPKGDDHRWSMLFKKASHLCASHSAIIDYSLAQATLEEAFLRLSQQKSCKSTYQESAQHLIPLGTFV